MAATQDKEDYLVGTPCKCQYTIVYKARDGPGSCTENQKILQKCLSIRSWGEDNLWVAAQSKFAAFWLDLKPKLSSPRPDLAPGGSDDWAYNLGIKYSFTFELQDRGRYGFLLPPSHIPKACNEALTAVKTIALKVIEKTQAWTETEKRGKVLLWLTRCALYSRICLFPLKELSNVKS